MSEIAQMIQQRVGLDEQTSQQVESVVVEMIQSKIPEQYRGMVNSLLGLNTGAQPDQQQSGEGGTLGGFGGLIGAAEGLLGNKG